MAVINITITQSADQVVSGIPRSISISANIPSIIFYTLDGSDPTLYSDQYVSAIVMPTNLLSVSLKVFASNGTDSSPIITENYITDMSNARQAHSATTAEAGENIANQYPFGNAPIQPNATFLSPGDAGITVNNTGLPTISNGFDSDGYAALFTNQTYDSSNYSIVFPTKDYQNVKNIGVGNFPDNFDLEKFNEIPEQSYQNSNMFDPRALVIFQDSTKENPNDPPHINKMSFNLEDPEKTRDGNSFFTSGLDSPPNSGTFLRSHYNPRTNMITYYYFDSWTNRWLISTTPYNPSGTWDGNMAGMASASGSPGARYVHEFRPFARRVLF
jgi:hypothetical protein